MMLITAKPDPTNPFNSLTGPQSSLPTNPALPKQQNLIDFFASIENEQTPIFPSQQQQQQFPVQSQIYVSPTFSPTFPQPTNQQFTVAANQQFYPTQPSFTPQQQFSAPQQPIRPEWTGAGFGGYTPSSVGSPVHMMPTIPSQTQFTQPVQNTELQLDHNSTGTNPFRASMLPQPTPQQNFMSDLSTGQTSHGTNPFASGQRAQPISPSSLTPTQSFSSQSFSSLPTTQSTYSQPFQNPSSPTFSQPQPQQPMFQQTNPSPAGFTQLTAAPQVPSSTGTNPFSRPKQMQSQARLTPQMTGSNPFRQNVSPGNGISLTQTGVPNGFDRSH